jgi:hypothetical protein
MYDDLLNNRFYWETLVSRHRVVFIQRAWPYPFHSRDRKIPPRTCPRWEMTFARRLHVATTVSDTTNILYLDLAEGLVFHAGLGGSSLKRDVQFPPLTIVALSPNTPNGPNPLWVWDLNLVSPVSADFEAVVSLQLVDCSPVFAW